jgi:Phosphoenolpyruvate hydrolase-like
VAVAVAVAARCSPRRPAQYVFDTDQAADMAKAGTDVLVPHMGLTSIGTIGAQSTITLQDASLRVQGRHDAAKKVDPDSGDVDTCFSTATCMRRYRIKCPTRIGDRSPIRHQPVSPTTSSLDEG